MRYVAFLRGVNVGGKNMVKMADLQAAARAGGFDDAKTYIQSGNIIFSSKTDASTLAARFAQIIERAFHINVEVAILSGEQLRGTLKNAPAWWGNRDGWKHNILILLDPADMPRVVAGYGNIKPDIEAMQPGDGVIYQSLSWDSFGKTVGGKLAGSAAYRLMTIRNYNTMRKLVELMDA